MNAVVFHEHGGPGKLQYQEMPMPTIGVDEVLVRVKACALNHLDIWIRQGSPAYPMPLPHILGSDISGVVHQIGSHVEGVAEGERVYVSPGVGCGRCEHCWAGRDNMCRSYGLIGAMCHGGYAEYVKVPARNVFPIPGALSFEQAAAFPPRVVYRSAASLDRCLFGQCFQRYSKERFRSASTANCPLPASSQV